MRHALIVAALAALVLGAPGEAGAVTMLSDARLTIPEFAHKTGQDVSVFEKRYASTGILACSGTYATAQLTIRHDIVTTAAHAFFDPEGRPRGDLSSCTFNIDVDNAHHSIPIEVSSLRVGSRRPYGVSPVHDWAVVRLKQGVPDARPYSLGTPNDERIPVVMLAHRHRGWVHDGMKAIEACTLRTAHRVDYGSAREIGIDCSAGEGASGSAILLPGSNTAMIGIYVGWRSTHPDSAGPYSPNHMNFGVAVEGPFRNAVLAVANEEKNPPAAKEPAIVQIHPAAVPEPVEPRRPATVQRASVAQ